MTKDLRLHEIWLRLANFICRREHGYRFYSAYFAFFYFRVQYEHLNAKRIVISKNMYKRCESMSFSIRKMLIPHDYEQVSELLNIVLSEETSAEELAEEDSKIPATGHLSKDEHGLLTGYGCR